MTHDIFKAYDTRGIYPKEINESVARIVARAVARRLKNGPLVIGHDTRLSSLKLYRATIGELVKTIPKKSLYAAGLTTTPQLYFLVNHLRAAGGIMITASHNPKQYNGFKVVKAKAQTIGGTELKRLIFED